MRARGSKGPEALSPFSADEATIAGAALAAATRNDWLGAMQSLALLSVDSLETLWSVALRFSPPTTAAHFEKSRLDREAKRRTAAPDLGILPSDWQEIGCGHLVEQMWITRWAVRCSCGAAFGRAIAAGLAAKVEAIAPKVHCRDWQYGDRPDRYHGKSCRPVSAAEAAKAAREAAAAHEETLRKLLAGELEDLDPDALDMPWSGSQRPAHYKRFDSVRDIPVAGFDAKPIQGAPVDDS